MFSFYSSSWHKLDGRTQATLRKLTQREGWMRNDIALAESGHPCVVALRVSVATHDTRPVAWVAGLVSHQWDGTWYETGIGAYVNRKYRGNGLSKILLSKWLKNFRATYGNIIPLYAAPHCARGFALYERHKGIQILEPQYD